MQKTRRVVSRNAEHAPVRKQGPIGHARRALEIDWLRDKTKRRGSKRACARRSPFAAESGGSDDQIGEPFRRIGNAGGLRGRGRRGERRRIGERLAQRGGETLRREF